MKYPNNIKKNPTNNKINTKISNKNKGDNLEYDLNLTNHYYLQHNIAIIHKKPTPIKVVEIEKKTQITIKKAFFQTPSTTDYNGIYKGKYIDFEAKETASTTSFALTNIHKHQIKHLCDVNKHGGIAFIIVLFTNLNKVFLMDITKLIEFINNHQRKSIPIKYFIDNTEEIKYNYHPRLDYLNIINKYIEGSERNE